jgi:hypothetical protein
MTSQYPNLTRGVALAAALLVFLGSLQQGQAICRLFGCGGACDGVSHSSAEGCPAHCCHEADSCCDSDSVTHSDGCEQQPCSGDESPSGPCDETCWCFAAQQPYEHTGKCQADLGLVVAWLPQPMPAISVSTLDSVTAEVLPSAPPLTALGRCVLLSRFLA